MYKSDFYEEKADIISDDSDWAQRENERHFDRAMKAHKAKTILENQFTGYCAECGYEIEGGKFCKMEEGDTVEDSCRYHYEQRMKMNKINGK